MTRRSLRRCCTAVAVAVVLAAALGDAASAASLHVRLSVPVALVAGAPCRAKVAVTETVRGTTAVLQERAGQQWRSIARKRLRSRSATLACAEGPAGRTLRFRAVLRRGERTIARSVVVSRRVLAASPAPQPAPPSPTPIPRPIPEPPGPPPY